MLARGESNEVWGSSLLDPVRDVRMPLEESWAEVFIPPITVIQSTIACIGPPGSGVLAQNALRFGGIIDVWVTYVVSPRHLFPKSSHLMVILLATSVFPSTPWVGNCPALLKFALIQSYLICLCRLPSQPLPKNLWKSGSFLSASAASKA